MPSPVKNFPNEAPEYVSKLWGYEKVLHNDDFCMKVLGLEPGFESSYHRHRRKDECFYVVSGCVVLTHDGVEYRLFPGQHARIKPKTWHKFRALSPSLVIEASTKHTEADVERKTMSRRIG